jgi:DNA-binding HxlR family transcriptional regulator
MDGRHRPGAPALSRAVFSELAQAVPEISDRLLSARLRELEMQGLVVRQGAAGLAVCASFMR